MPGRSSDQAYDRSQLLLETVDVVCKTVTDDTLHAAFEFTGEFMQTVFSALGDGAGIVSAVIKLTKALVPVDEHKQRAQACAIAFGQAMETAMQKSTTASLDLQTVLGETKRATRKGTELTQIDAFRRDEACSTPFYRETMSTLLNLLQRAGMPAKDRGEFQSRHADLYVQAFDALIEHPKSADRFKHFAVGYNAKPDAEESMDFLKRHNEWLRRQWSEKHVSPNDPFPLSSVYLPTPLRDENGILQPKTDRLCEFVVSERSGHLFVVEGPGGTGKSSMIKKLCVDLVNQGFQPVLVHLRSVPDKTFSPTDLEYAIGRRMEALDDSSGFLLDGGVFEERFVYKGREQGRTVLIFDGLDEISAESIAHLRVYIHELMKIRRRLRIVAAGRPGSTAIITEDLRLPFTKLYMCGFGTEEVMAFVKLDSRARSYEDVSGLLRLMRTPLESLAKTSAIEASTTGDPHSKVNMNDQETLDRESHYGEILSNPFLLSLVLRLLREGDEALLERLDTNRWSMGMILRSLVELTAETGGRRPEDKEEIIGSDRIAPNEHRKVLQRIATWITLTGKETADVEPLKKFLIYAHCYDQNSSHPPTAPAPGLDLFSVAINYFYEVGTEKEQVVSLEFSHKLLRQYLFCEYLAQALIAGACDAVGSLDWGFMLSGAIWLQPVERELLGEALVHESRDMHIDLSSPLIKKLAGEYDEICIWHGRLAENDALAGFTRLKEAGRSLEESSFAFRSKLLDNLFYVCSILASSFSVGQSGGSYVFSPFRNVSFSTTASIINATEGRPAAPWPYESFLQGLLISGARVHTGTFEQLPLESRLTLTPEPIEPKFLDFSQCQIEGYRLGGGCCVRALYNACLLDHVVVLNQRWTSNLERSTVRSSTFSKVSFCPYSFAPGVTFLECIFSACSFERPSDFSAFSAWRGDGIVLALYSSTTVDCSFDGWDVHLVAKESGTHTNLLQVENQGDISKGTHPRPIVVFGLTNLAKSNRFIGCRFFLSGRHIAPSEAINYLPESTFFEQTQR